MVDIINKYSKLAPNVNEKTAMYMISLPIIVLIISLIVLLVVKADTPWAAVDIQA